MEKSWFFFFLKCLRENNFLKKRGFVMGGLVGFIFGFFLFLFFYLDYSLNNCLEINE